uniref:Uncharacterized protein n=1 Tax=Magallana gigas TaxID=29159 RepID=K1QH20_MAGGI
MDGNRVKKREKMSLPETKRRRLILKQERANQKDASEVSEGSTYQSVRQGAMPHITQIGAVEMESGEAFSTYVLPKISIEPGAEQATGKVYDGTSVFANGLKVAAVPIREALLNFLKWLSTLRNCEVVLVAHNGRVFDFRVLSNAVVRTGLQKQFLDKVSGFTDSLSLIRSKHKKT